MADTGKGIRDLLQQHEAIRTHMKYLTRTLKKLTAQSYKGTAAELREIITLYRWPLYDFREAIRRHIEMDDRIFGVLFNKGMSAEMDRGHLGIRARIDEVIRLAEDAAYSKLGRKELNASAADIKDAVKLLCDTCQAHIAREDAILEHALKDFNGSNGTRTR
jgi:hypothetical protein